MHRSTRFAAVLTTPLIGRGLEWSKNTSCCLHHVEQLVEDFLNQAVTPTTLCRFEHALQELLQRFGRTTLEWTVNQLEPEELPAQVCRDGEWYRLRPKSPRRSLDSLFGPVRLWRYR
jgi:hypothetical protein